MKTLRQEAGVVVVAFQGLRCPAECHSAIQQINNLRYGPSGRTESNQKSKWITPEQIYANAETIKSQRGF